MRILLAALLATLHLPAWAATACFQDCARQGHDRSYCVTFCERSPSGGGLLDQPGVPRNPYLDAIPDPVPKRKQPLPPLPRYDDPRNYGAPPYGQIDPRCMDDCRYRGHQVGYCRKQCSY